MRELKDLLEPLGDRPMPDRWEAIQHRPVRPMSEPHRSRVSAGIAAAAVAILAIGVIVWLSPLSGPHEEAGGSTGGQPPSWLVDKAYELAYQNGDLVPDRAEWVLADADVVAPAVGLQVGDRTGQEYLVVLRGHFTGYATTGPPGAAAPTGSTLVQAFAADSQAPLDFGITNDVVNVPGLAPFALPDSFGRYVSPQGWTVPLPPGWSASEFSIRTGQGSLITNPPGSSATTNAGGGPFLSGEGLSGTGVAFAVADILPDPQTGAVPVPPLSWSDFGPAVTDPGQSLFILPFEGPRQLFTLEVRIGDQASPQDVAAVHDMVAGLAFGDEAATLPSPTGAPGLPTQDSVVDGRFVTDVILDEGAFSVQPAPIDTVPVLSKADAEQLLFASPVFQGKANGVVGFGLVTSRVSQHGVSTFESDPAWIAFGWGGTYSCPAITAGAPSPEDLPSSGYVAVALIEGAGGGDISYEARSDPCGTVFGPTVRAATHIESVPWTQTGPTSGGTIPVRYTPPPCGVPFSNSAAGQGSVYTLTVEVEVPDDPGSCASPAPIDDAVQLNPNGQPITQVDHGPTGIARQAAF